MSEAVLGKRDIAPGDCVLGVSGQRFAGRGQGFGPALLLGQAAGKVIQARG